MSRAAFERIDGRGAWPSLSVRDRPAKCMMDTIASSAERRMFTRRLWRALHRRLTPLNSMFPTLTTRARSSHWQILVPDSTSDHRQPRMKQPTPGSWKPCSRHTHYFQRCTKANQIKRERMPGRTPRITGSQEGTPENGFGRQKTASRQAGQEI